MAKKSSINIPKNMADKIPYLRCYEEQGIIETEHRVFTCGFEIRRLEKQIQTQYNIQFVRSCMETILKDVAEEGLSYQFCVRNRRVDEQGYLRNLLAKNHGEEKLDIYARAYNTTIQDNTSVGHNNFETRIYYIVSYLSDIVEEAIEKFCLKLPRYKRPKKIIFADIPRNPTGKIEKPVLRKMYCVDNLVERENQS